MLKKFRYRNYRKKERKRRFREVQKTFPSAFKESASDDALNSLVNNICSYEFNIGENRYVCTKINERVVGIRFLKNKSKSEWTLIHEIENEIYFFACDCMNPECDSIIMVVRSKAYSIKEDCIEYFDCQTKRFRQVMDKDIDRFITICGFGSNHPNRNNLLNVEKKDLKPYTLPFSMTGTRTK